MLTNEKAQVESELDKARAKLEALEERVVEAESLNDEKDEEIAGLRDRVDKEKGRTRSHANLLHKSMASQRMLIEEEGGFEKEERFRDVAALLNGFEVERRGMEEKNVELRRLLKEALEDIRFLTSR